MNRSEKLAALAVLVVISATFVNFRRDVFNPHGSAPEAASPSAIPLARLKPLAQVLQSGRGGSVVVEALDYQCPPCHALEESNHAYRRAHPDVGWLVIQFPLRMHRMARPLSVLALAAAHQGVFVRFHEAAMSRIIHSDQSVEAFVRSVDPSFAAFAKTNLRETPDIKATLRATTKLPIDGTPTLLAFRPDGASLTLHRPDDLDGFFSKKG